MAANQKQGMSEMKNDTTNNTQIDQKFLQVEPAELDETALLNVAGGALPETYYTYTCSEWRCYKK
jgi:hypothetical protein